MNHTYKHLIASVIIATLQMASTGISHANVLEEMVVTATKRGASSVQDSALTVQVLNGEELTARGAFDFVDFAATVPGLQFQDLGPGDKKYIIRGVNSTGPSTVGVYFDETIVTASNKNDGGGRNVDIKLIDMQGIEVLKGPQGTLYGANSMSGLIKYVANKPSAEEFETFVNFDLSDTGEASGSNSTVSAMANIPLSDTLALRLVGYRADNTGFIDQPRALTANGQGLADINGEETIGGRLALRLEPNDRTTIDFMYLQQETESGGSSRFTPEGITSFGDPAAVAAITPDRGLINTDIVRSPWEDEFDIFGLTANFDFDTGVLTGTYNKFDRDVFFNFDASPLQYFFGNANIGEPFGEAVTQQPQKREVETAEIRFASELDGPLQFLVGGYVQREDTDFGSFVVLVDNNGIPAAFSADPADNEASGGTTTFGRIDIGELKQTALFGELIYSITDDLELTAGMRRFDSALDSFEQTLAPLGGGMASEGLENSFDDDKITGKLNLSYKVTDDILLYSTVAQGFRVGGLNAADIPFAQNSIPQGFESDELINYEFGFKTELLDRRLRLNGALYRVEWQDIQSRAVDNTGGITFTTNAGEAEITGFEFDGTALLGESLELLFGASLINAELTEDQPDLGAGNNGNRGLAGDNLPNIPSLQAFLAIKYGIFFDSGMVVNLRADVAYRDSVNTQLREISPFNVALDSYSLVDLRATFELKKDIDVSLYVKNATDERAEIDAISSNQDPLSLVTNRPRTIGINLRKEF